MVMTDPIADMLTRIRNANSVYHDKGDSRVEDQAAIVEILKLEGSLRITR
jgi:small subunit ribosomal protein S8